MGIASRMALRSGRAAAVSVARVAGRSWPAGGAGNAVSLCAVGARAAWLQVLVGAAERRRWAGGRRGGVGRAAPGARLPDALSLLPMLQPPPPCPPWQPPRPGPSSPPRARRRCVPSAPATSTWCSARPTRRWRPSQRRRTSSWPVASRPVPRRRPALRACTPRRERHTPLRAGPSRRAFLTRPPTLNLGALALRACVASIFRKFPARVRSPCARSLPALPASTAAQQLHGTTSTPRSWTKWWRVLAAAATWYAAHMRVCVCVGGRVCARACPTSARSRHAG